MKISCEKAILQSALSDAIRAVSPKNAIPALEGFLLSATDDSLTVTGYNGEIGIRTTVGAMVEDPSALILTARLTYDIVRSLPDDVVTIESAVDFMTTVSCGASVFNIIGQNPKDFPELPIVREESDITLPSGVLRTMIGGTLFAASDNENNPITTGCKFEFTENLLTVIALDYFRMAIRREEISYPSADSLAFVVPGKALRELERFLPDTDDPVRIALSRKIVSFTVGNTVLTSQLLEGEFMNYQNVLPKISSVHVNVQTATFMRSLERTSIIINETLKNHVEFRFDGSLLRLSCITSVGRAYDECPIETVSGEPLRIGFNGRYLLDALRACHEDTVRMEMNTDKSPCVIVPTEGDRFLYFIMPRRLQEAAV